VAATATPLSIDEFTGLTQAAGFDMVQAGGATQPPILHLTLFNPLDDYYGLSPLEAAACAVDTHNAAARWNKALLDNAARPSGALVYGGPEGGTLTHEQFDRLKRELEREYQGAANAGRPLVLEGGLDWKAMSLTPKDMDFMEAKHAAAREIALAFGVPPMLLGIPGDNTFANYQEANRSFFRQTVLPLAARTGSAVAQWLSPQFGDGIRVTIDTDAPEILARCLADKVDVAVIVPNCPVCHQTSALVARHLEANGIATVVMGCAKDIVEHAAVPRFLFSDFPLGNSAGKPHDIASQAETLELALRLLETASGARTTMQSPLRWSEDASWKLDYNNVAQMSPEELARRRAEFDKQKEIARGNRAA